LTVFSKFWTHSDSRLEKELFHPVLDSPLWAKNSIFFIVFN
jgi:hypothetical protein